MPILTIFILLILLLLECVAVILCMHIMCELQYRHRARPPSDIYHFGHLVCMHICMNGIHAFPTRSTIKQWFVFSCLFFFFFASRSFYTTDRSKSSKNNENWLTNEQLHNNKNVNNWNGRKWQVGPVFVFVSCSINCSRKKLHFVWGGVGYVRVGRGWIVHDIRLWFLARYAHWPHDTTHRSNKKLKKKKNK